MPAKLTLDEIRTIQALIGTEPTHNLAVRFGVHVSTIREAFPELGSGMA
jgi:hypothetical protein